MNRLWTRDAVIDGVETQRDALIELSQRIHANPELGYQEFKASSWLMEYLVQYGFDVERGVCGFPTAFRATYGSGVPTIAVVAEYDALPGIGHACGHNIIGTAAVGAAVAVRESVQAMNAALVVIGTPAEEGGGGKVHLVQRGAFDGLDAALMFHPGTRDTVLSRSLASVGLEVEFFGKAAHAATRPEEGVNALEAMILAFNAIDALRQHIRGRARVHGIITKGGDAPNVVPAYTAARFLVRTETDDELPVMQERVLNCFRAAALATGARLEYKWAEEVYFALRTNRTLAEAFGANLERLGRTVHRPNPRRGLGSTDMGNVSAVAPAIHPSIGIAPTAVVGHSQEFAAAAASEAGNRGLLDGAKALAMTVFDLVADPALLERVQEEFRRASEDRHE